MSQIRECAATLLKYAKSTATSIFIIGHITKDGAIAGPKILEHIVDVVLQFEGDSNNVYRILRGIKNRFGATYEIGVFEMLDSGLRGIDNPSEILLTHYEEALSGIAVGASADGVRPYLIEVQALVSGAAYGTPQRTATGFDARRMSMLLAVVEKRIGLKMFQKDVFLNFAGGFKVADPGLDLAVVAASLPITTGPSARASAVPAKSAFRAKYAPPPAPNSASAKRPGWASGASSSRATWPRESNGPKASRSFPSATSANCRGRSLWNRFCSCSP